MTRVLLAAGVAALAIAAPAYAGPHGGGGGHDRQQQAARPNHGGGGGGGQRAQAVQQQRGGGGGGGHAMRMQMPRAQHQQMAFQRPQRAQQHVQMHAQRQRPERAQMRMAQRQQAHGNHAQAQQRMAARQQPHGNHAQAQQRMAARQQMHGNHMQAQNRQQLRAERVQQAQNRSFDRQQMRANRMAQVQNVRGNARIERQTAMGFAGGGCPPGLISKGCMPPGLAGKNIGQLAVQDRVATLRSLGDRRFVPVDFARRDIFAPMAAASLLGVPISTAAAFGTFSPLPQDLAYLYPSTPDYYYQYGNGYLYQVDRGNSLIDALIPLLAGGFLPGSYLPQSYMSSYVPSYYGLNSFYPANYGYGGYGGYGAYGYGAGYGGYGYNNMCNRYANGVVYQVDCVTGMVENVVPLYAGGYGVGQMLPSAYNYYNVPLQYRSMYYPSADYSYWYAPGAIYQYDTRSSLITSVAALMSPGFSIGQPLPAGYGMYNVPLDYRATYYDTPNAWYRYNNGYIYQVNPTTQLVTAIVASLLT